MNQEKKWTQGPWKIGNCDDTVKLGQSGYTVMSDGLHSQEITANAALISAAPELVEALEKLERIAYSGIKHHLERCTCSLCKDFLSAQAALVKAYGEVTP